jgi:MSHA biogenesis protein MshG
MAYFNYKARNNRGELMQGVLEGADRGAVASYLLNTGATPVEINLSDNDTALAPASLFEQLTAPPVTNLDVQMFSRQMYTLLKANVPIMQALKGLEDSASNKNFGRVLKSLRAALDAGRDLSASLREHPKVFSQYYVSMVQVGEMTGGLTQIFPRLHDYLALDRKMQEQITSALRYPKFVIFAIVAAIAVVSAFVIPQFAKIFMKAHFELPLMTRALLAVSSFTVNYWQLILAGVAVATFFFRKWVATKEGRYAWDKTKLRLPVAGQIILKGTMARFARSYALADHSGVPVSQALSVVARTVDNAYIARAVEQVRDGVERGESMLRAATMSGVFMPRVLQMIGVGEETGEIGQLMDEIADMYEQEVEYELKTLASRIEPILIMFIGVLVLILALGVFVPMWDMGQVQLKRRH